MQTHTRRRIEIIAEMAIAPMIEELLITKGASGYTVLQASEGRGTGGAWREGIVSSAESKVMIIVYLRRELADDVLSALRPILDLYAVVAAVTDIEVLRGNKF